VLRAPVCLCGQSRAVSQLWYCFVPTSAKLPEGLGSACTHSQTCATKSVRTCSVMALAHGPPKPGPSELGEGEGYAEQRLTSACFIVCAGALCIRPLSPPFPHPHPLPPPPPTHTHTHFSTLEVLVQPTDDGQPCPALVETTSCSRSVPTLCYDPPACTNGMRDAGEADVDCGSGFEPESGCQKCAVGLRCARTADCDDGLACSQSLGTCVGGCPALPAPVTPALDAGGLHAACVCAVLACCVVEGVRSAPDAALFSVGSPLAWV
jgi:hypothetical protein